MFTFIKLTINNLVEAVKLLFDTDYQEWKNYNPQYSLGNYEKYEINVCEFKKWN